jgi:hypothetical protein
MSSQTVTVTFIAGIAVLMAAGFLVVWWRDKRNADEVEDDPERLDTSVDTDVDLGSDSTPSTPSTPVPTTNTSL